MKLTHERDQSRYRLHRGPRGSIKTPAGNCAGIHSGTGTGLILDHYISHTGDEMLQQSRIRELPAEMKPDGSPGVQITNIKMNDRSLEFPAGFTVVEAAEKAGIRLPALCHGPRVKPSGNCRLCLVEIEGHERPVASCGRRSRKACGYRQTRLS